MDTYVPFIPVRVVPEAPRGSTHATASGHWKYAIGCECMNSYTTSGLQTVHAVYYTCLIWRKREGGLNTDPMSLWLAAD